MPGGLCFGRDDAQALSYQGIRQGTLAYIGMTNDVDKGRFMDF
jgi:hypothetical protein